MRVKDIEAVIVPKFGRISYRNAWNFHLIVIALQNTLLEVEGESIKGQYLFSSPLMNLCLI